MEKLRKRSLSWLLALSMVFSLFGGEIAGTKDVQAEGEGTEATINVGTAKYDAENGYYSYPDLVVENLGEKKIYQLSVSVSSGFMAIPKTSISGIEGEGVVPGDEDLFEESHFTALKSSNYYVALLFDSDTGFNASQIQEYLRTVQIFPDATSKDVQTITFVASTLRESDLKATVTVGGEKRTIQLYYYNGHYYGYVDAYGTNWLDAYNAAETGDFLGLKGYLATLTSKAEDRFLLTKFPHSSIEGKAMKGWIGATRDKAVVDTAVSGKKITSVTPEESLPKMQNHNDPNFLWYWASGPETGDLMGQQTYAVGSDENGKSMSGPEGDGGFDNQGRFSNWQSGGNGSNAVEPNGGASINTYEAYGYYGEYLYGRWNDYPSNGNWSMEGFYVEFGGYPDDKDTLDKNLKDNQIVIEVEEPVNKKDDAETASPKATEEASASPSADVSSSPEATEAASASPSADVSSSPEATEEASASPSADVSSSPEATEEASASPSADVSSSPEATEAASASPSAEATASTTPKSTPTAKPMLPLTGKPNITVETEAKGAKDVDTTLKVDYGSVGLNGISALTYTETGKKGSERFAATYESPDTASTTKEYELGDSVGFLGGLETVWKTKVDGEEKIIAKGKTEISVSDYDLMGKEVWVELSVPSSGTSSGKYAADVNGGAEFTYKGSVSSSGYTPKESDGVRQIVTGTPVIVPEGDLKADEKLKADVSNLDPKDFPDSGDMVITWYVYDPEDPEAGWKQADPSKSNMQDEYKLGEDDLGKQIMAVVTVYPESIIYSLKKDKNGKDIVNGTTGLTGLHSQPLTIPEKDGAQPTPTPTAVVTDKKEIKGKPVVENPAGKNEVGTELKANVDNVTGPDGEDGEPEQLGEGDLKYQWYIQDDKGRLTPIPGAEDPVYTLTEDTLDKDIVVAVTGQGDYYGTRNSDPYTAAETRLPLKGKPEVWNLSQDDKGKDIVHAGTILKAKIGDSLDEANAIAGKTSAVKSPVLPEGYTDAPDDMYDNLTYQWYINKNNGAEDSWEEIPAEEGGNNLFYIVQSKDFWIDEDGKVPSFYTDANGNQIESPMFRVEVTGKGKYEGTLESDNYKLGARTDSDLEVLENEEDPDGRIIKVTPTQDNTLYGIRESDGEGNIIIVPCYKLVPNPDDPEHPKKIYVDPNAVYEEESGYYSVNKGDTLYFEVEKDKEYVVVEIHLDEETGEYVENYTIISKELEDPKMDYDDKGTANDNTDDTISLSFDPADPETKYAILKEENGKYEIVTVDYDPTTGTYVPTDEKDGGHEWSNGGENHITFSELPADGTYKIVSIGKDDKIADLVGTKIDPSEIKGGTTDIVSEPKAITGDNTGKVSGPKETDDKTPSATESPAPGDGTGAAGTATPPAVSAAPNGSATTLTPEQQSNVDKFFNEYCKDPFGAVITSITDLTKDIVISGETDWNSLTETEKNAVNQMLKENGCPYTYPELLELANAHKIPFFKLHKVMKKGTKAKLKLVKCKGATVVVTSTNKKVATINKKGVIKAKKKGKARLTIVVSKDINGEAYANRLVVNIEVRKKFKNATELKKFKSKVVKTPTILIAKKRVLKKSTKIKIYGLETDAKISYKSYNKKALPLNKKGKYTAKKKGKSLMRCIVKQNDHTYFLYLYVTAFKKGKSKKK